MKTKLLFLCSANMDRSPAAEALFEGSTEFEAKSAGLSELTRENLFTPSSELLDDIHLI